MRISIKFIPHKKQRYETLGDWQYKNEKLNVRISDTGEWKLNCLLLIHELVEAWLCKDKEITDSQVDEWDFGYANVTYSRAGEEPGDDPDCPYYDQHGAATMIEKMMANFFGIDWRRYEKRLQEIEENQT